MINRMRHEQDEARHVGGLVPGHVLVTYQLLGWLGVLFLVAAGAIGGVSTIFINRKVKRDEQIAQFRNQPDRLDAPSKEPPPEG